MIDALRTVKDAQTNRIKKRIIRHFKDIGQRATNKDSSERPPQKRKHQQSISSDDSDQDSGILPLRRRLVVNDYEAEDSDH